MKDGECGEILLAEIIPANGFSARGESDPAGCCRVFDRFTDEGWIVLQRRRLKGEIHECPELFPLSGILLF